MNMWYFASTSPMDLNGLEVPGSILGYTLEVFLDVLDLERGPPSLVSSIG